MSRKSLSGTVALYYVLLIVYFAVIAYPLLWMLINSFRESGEIFGNSWGLPKTWLFSNYATAWHSGISDYFLNSVFVTTIVCLLVVFLSALGAFGISRFEFKGKSLLLILCLGGLMLSPQVSLIPLYKLIQALGLHNTHWALILPYAAYRIPLSLLLVRSFFLSVPKEFEEAAYMDGSSTFGIFMRIFIPLSVPILFTVVILTAYFAWNEFMFAIVFIDSERLKTIPAGLMQFRDMLQTDWGVLLAGLMISALPVIILFLSMQRFFIRGLAAGGVKG
ncbi:carbohydrate ABC transporter permease [Paenibacillus sp. A3]|uniref:carbohydrate ABC transporter permease n=1 Tax=Paenibacillus sp. A3 TaxID=1337054 RepID=UPI0009E6D55E|nr:carbohydrate ABC transporter permease [Paenibacillus sp. A3]